MPRCSVALQRCPLRHTPGELSNDRRPESEGRNIVRHNSNLPFARKAEPDFLGQFAPDSTMAVATQYKEFGDVIGLDIARRF